MKTLEDLEKVYQGKEKDMAYWHLQAVLGTRQEAASAYDEEGNFHCIHWFDCRYCPAFTPEHCL